MELYQTIYAVYLADILHQSLDDDNEIYKPYIDERSLIEIYNKIQLNNKLDIISKKKSNKKVNFNNFIDIVYINLDIKCSYGYNNNNKCIFCNNKFNAVGKLLIKEPFKQNEFKLSFCLNALLHEFNKNKNFYHNIFFY